MTFIKGVDHSGIKNGFYGRKHSEEFKQSRRREGNPSWKGGRLIDAGGYIRILAPTDTPKNMITKDGYVKEQKYVWWKNNGNIPKGFVIHHINHNKQDNRIENLELIEHGLHSSYHNKGNEYPRKYYDSTVVNWVTMNRDGISLAKISKQIKVDKTVVWQRITKFKEDYPMPNWAVQQIVRETGLVEDICSHGIGHSNLGWLSKFDKENNKGFSIHGCDGCCNENTHRKTSTKRIR